MDTSDFTWEVSCSNPDDDPCLLEVVGRWTGPPQVAVGLEEEHGGSATLVLSLKTRPGPAAPEVAFRRLTHFGDYEVVAIGFPNGKSERIYLPNYDPRSDYS